MTGDKYAVEVSNITKKFRLYDDKGYTLKEKALHWGRNRYEYREVLKGISFQIKKGEAVGLIGQNGCGKSTVLKLLTKIMYPDSGTICVRGRVSSLLELGAGFHPDMSGRENIYINASILGLTKKEIDRRIDSIIAFSELEEFIDNPVRTYSSGMYMRLAFSVAVSVDADVLLIDEILAVGDVNFQAKCFRKLMEIKGAGTTIVIVSHSMDQVERICDRSFWIQDGQVKQVGSPFDVHRNYLDAMSMKRKQRSVDQAVPDDSEAKPDDAVSFVSAKLRNKGQSIESVFRLGEMLVLEIEMDTVQNIEEHSSGLIEINLVRADGLFCYGCAAPLHQAKPVRAKDSQQAEKMNIRLVYPHMNLLPGWYHFDLHIADNEGGTIYFGGNIAEFEIEADSPQRGLFYLEHEWTKG
ncbi:MAG: ABC transporter ATP-binding protein [Eubacterium sp.]|jgi:ABC-2 type transport system ATP-binding protein|nr:ABC transporter ATP-binding protein [Eubacterium sp.]